MDEHIARNRLRVLGDNLRKIDLIDNFSAHSEITRELIDPVSVADDLMRRAASALSLAADEPSFMASRAALLSLQNLYGAAVNLFDGIENVSLLNIREMTFHNIATAEIIIKEIMDNYYQPDSNIERAVIDAPDLPGNRPAPIQAIIVDDILSVTNPQNRLGSVDYPSANRVREGLRKTLQGLVDDLPSSSNVDRGYVRACARLLECLSTPIEELGIEELGLQYQLVQKITRRVANEIGASMLDEIEHVLTGVSVLLNQFEEWRRYLDELARTQLDPEDGDGLVASAVSLIAELEKPGAPVDLVLIKRLRAMVEPAVTGIIGADTVAIPLVCSLSNIFSALSQYAIDHYENLGPGAQHVALAGAAGLLAKLSVDLIEKFCPVLSKYQPLSFIISVMRYLLPMYSQTKDVSS